MTQNTGRAVLPVINRQGHRNSLTEFEIPTRRHRIPASVLGIQTRDVFGDSSGATARQILRLEKGITLFELSSDKSPVRCIFSPLLHRLNYLGQGAEAGIE